jgi:hypothetical protein
MNTLSRAGLTLVTGACLTLVAAPAGAHPGDHEDPPGGGVAEVGEWTPAAEDYYAPFEVPACGDTITVEGGDVRAAEQRVSTLHNGATLIEFRGEVTTDLTRRSDGAMIDELDISGVTSTLISADGTRVKETLFGASLLFPVSQAEVAEFVEAFGTDLAYFTDPEESVRAKVTVDPVTNEVLELRSIEIDADIEDLCTWFDDHDDHDDDHDDDDETYRHDDEKDHHHGD